MAVVVRAACSIHVPSWSSAAGLELDTASKCGAAVLKSVTASCLFTAMHAKQDTQQVLEPCDVWWISCTSQVSLLGAYLPTGPSTGVNGSVSPQAMNSGQLTLGTRSHGFGPAGPAAAHKVMHMPVVSSHSDKTKSTCNLRQATSQAGAGRNNWLQNIIVQSMPFGGRGVILPGSLQHALYLVQDKVDSTLPGSLEDAPATSL